MSELYFDDDIVKYIIVSESTTYAPLKNFPDPRYSKEK
jgi:hypothetical protein